MRTYDKIEAAKYPNMIEKRCDLNTCNRAYYTNISKTKFCCDHCRGRGHGVRHKSEIDFLQNWKRQFKTNYLGLKRLYERGVRFPTKQELAIVDFDFETRQKSQQTKNGNIAYQYFEYAIVQSLLDTQVEIVMVTEKQTDPQLLGFMFTKFKDVEKHWLRPD